MPKYEVELTETVQYTVVVEAENGDQAGEEAAIIWAESEDPTADFQGTGEGVDVSFILLLEGS